MQKLLRVRVDDKAVGYIVFILLIQLVFGIYLNIYLYPIAFYSQNFLVAAVVNKTTEIPVGVILLFNLVNTLYIWFIARTFFKSELSLLAPLIYAISPWANYLSAAGSYYILFLFLVLNTTYGLVLIKSQKNKLGYFMLVIGTVGSIYGSLRMEILAGVFCCFVSTGIIKLKYSVKFILLVLVLSVPMFILTIQNRNTFFGLASREIRIFSDPGLINGVNLYKGESQRFGLGYLSKLSENRYVSTVEYVLLKYLKNIIPSTFFTSEEKLLNFSFSPPIYLGFVAPFMYGTYLVLHKPEPRKKMLIATTLVIPSVLANQTVDLNRLILFFPIAILVICFGIGQLYKKRDQTRHKLILVTALLLIIFQIILTLGDIRFREELRFVRYFGNKYYLSS